MCDNELFLDVLWRDQAVLQVDSPCRLPRDASLLCALRRGAAGAHMLPTVAPDGGSSGPAPVRYAENGKKVMRNQVQ